MRKKSSPIKIFPSLFFAGLVILGGCEKRGEDSYPDVELPVTPVLSLEKTWGLIVSSHLRLREKPSLDAPAPTTLWKGYVIEILNQSSTKDTVEGITEYWYQINYGELLGWVFGGYIEVYRSRDDADRASREKRG